MSESRQTVIGRITQLDGHTVVVPLDQQRATLAHQKRLNELIKAARKYAAEPIPQNIEPLLKAARSLDT